MKKLGPIVKMNVFDFASKRQEKIALMEQDETILEFLKANQLSNEELHKYFLSFEEVYDNRLNCQNCKGLNHCKQSVKGQRLALDYDKIVYNQIEFCDYYLNEKKQFDYLKNYLYSDIPEELLTVTLNDLIDTSSDKNLLYGLIMIAEKKEKRGLYIFGDLGIGKTYHCIALLNTMAQKGHSVAFVKVNDFINKARKLIINDYEALEDIIASLKKVDVLVLDDIGSESVSSFGRDDLLFDILDHRMEDKKTTLFTSNLDLDSLLNHYSFDKKERKEELKAKRFIERVEVLAQSYLMKGENKRQK